MRGRMQTLATRRAREERFARATGNPVRFQRARRGGTGQAVTWRRQSGTSKPEPTKRSQEGIALLVLGLIGAGVAGYLVVKAIK